MSLPIKRWTEELGRHGSFTDDEVRSFLVANKLLHFPSEPDPEMLHAWRRNPPVTLRASPVHGQGVFALRNIEPHEFLTIYPVHMVFWGAKRGIYVEGRHGRPAVPRWQFDYAASGDAFGCKYDIVGFPTILEPHYLGHMINDRLKLTSAADVETYSRLGPTVTNVDFVKFGPEEETLCKGADSNLYVMATKRISAGEELFVSYGEAYWLKMLALDQHDQRYALSTMD